MLWLTSYIYCLQIGYCHIIRVQLFKSPNCNPLYEMMTKMKKITHI